MSPDFLLRLMGREQCKARYYPYRWSSAGYNCQRPEGHMGMHIDGHGTRFGAPFDNRAPEARMENEERNPQVKS